MGRLSQQAAAAATAPNATPVVLVELDLATGPFRVWTGLWPLDWAGKVFKGAGHNRIGLDIWCATATAWNTSIRYQGGHFARATGTSAHPPDAAPHLGHAPL